METLDVRGVGTLLRGAEHWECLPIQLNGSILNIESTAISLDQEERARWICSNWEQLLTLCMNYISMRRGDYGLDAVSFVDPNVFINSGEEWSIYFDTEHAIDAIVGVDFRGETPFQLTIGD
jgi:hypothetical protein